MALVACGDNADLFPDGDHYELEFASLSDGEIITRPVAQNAGTYFFFRINGDAENVSGLTLTTELYNAAGDLIVRQEKTAPSINADTAIELSPQLASGQYEVDLTLLRKGAFLVKATRSFFLVKNPPVIQGILSYPLVITPHSPVLLIADVQETADLNQFLRWKQGKKIIAKGLLSEGYNQILWEAPDVDGVASVTVEVFPFPPVDTDYLFPAQFSAAAELFISSREKEKEKESASTATRPHYSLFDIYVSALREREKAVSGLRQPRPVIRDEAIGMKFDGRTGFACPELVAPVRSRTLTAWNVALGVTFEGDNTGRRIFSLASADKAFTLEGTIAQEGEPVLRLSTKDNAYLFPSGLTKLAPGVRTLLSISVIPSAVGWRVVWKQDGAVATDTRQVINLEPGDDKGWTILGGDNSARCVIDTFDVFIE